MRVRNYTEINTGYGAGANLEGLVTAIAVMNYPAPDNIAVTTIASVYLSAYTDFSYIFIS